VFRGPKLPKTRNKLIVGATIVVKRDITPIDAPIHALMPRDGNGLDMGRIKKMPARDNIRGRSSSQPMIIPAGKNSYSCPYLLGNGRVSGTHGYMTCQHL
jgi:hypothetical protein